MNNYGPWLKYVARTGYAAKAVAYCLLGMLIVQSALHTFGSDAPTKKDVFQTIQHLYFGELLLILVILGLVCYSAWRLFQLFLNTEDLDKTGFKDNIQRVFFLFSAVAYMSIAYGAYKVLTNKPDSENAESSQQTTATLLQYSWGVWLVVILGLVVFFFAFVQFKHAYLCDFMEKLTQDKMTSKGKTAAKWAGRFGYIARGGMYLMIGGFFLSAAYHHDPEKAGGLKKLLITITQETYGQYMLVAVGTCLLLFGVFCGFEARYRKVD